MVYQIFRLLMASEDKRNDEVVRITAARQLKWVADDFGFEAESFLPFASDTLDMLIKLLREVNIDETKLAILETTRIIVSRLETHVSAVWGCYYGHAARPVGFRGERRIHDQAVDLSHHERLGYVDARRLTKYQNFMIPLLREAMNPESALHLHLIEESVELWKSILMQSMPP